MFETAPDVHASLTREAEMPVNLMIKQCFFPFHIATGGMMNDPRGAVACLSRGGWDYNADVRLRVRENPDYNIANFVISRIRRV